MGTGGASKGICIESTGDHAEQKDKKSTFQGIGGGNSLPSPSPPQSANAKGGLRMMGDRAACTKPAVIFVVLACFLFPLLRLLILVRDFTVEILYYQQLDFYDAYFQKLSWAQIFRFQHGEHRLGVGGILQAIVLDASSWRNSAVSYSIVTVLLLAALSVLFLKRRMSGRLEIIDGALPILFLTSNQYETIVIAPSLAA